MSQTRANLAVVLALLATVLSIAALIVALRHQPPKTDRFGFTPEQRAEAQAKADHLRSATGVRGLAMGVMFWAQNHDGEAPPADSWQQALLDDDLIAPEILQVHGGADVETPYHYIRPTKEQLAAVQDGGTSSVVVFYEDPALWNGDGGNLTTLDTMTTWIDGEAYAQRVRELRESP